MTDIEALQSAYADEITLINHSPRIEDDRWWWVADELLRNQLCISDLIRIGRKRGISEQNVRQLLIQMYNEYLIGVSP